jgi:predicted dehydrogenase
MDEKVSIGIVGTGSIFGTYVTNCRAFDILEIAACSDLDLAKAKVKAEEFGISRACAVKELLADPEIQIVVNLTVPRAHADISLAAIRAGKHVYSEKPLAISRQEGQQILLEAYQQGLQVGCAPDTFLGGGQQTCRKLLDDGWIGEPVAAAAFMTGHGPESWHPNPDFFYQVGGGPLFDVGPYYLTALVHLLGPVQRVTGSTRISFRERIATSPEHYKRRIPVEVPTHVTGIVDFASGPLATVITSFDIWSSNLPYIEIYGSEGTLSVPDPNRFGGPIRLRRAVASEWTEVPLSHDAEVGRGIGVADLAYAITAWRPHRASGKLAYHILDVMHAFGESSQTGRHVQIESHCERPTPLPLGLPKGELDG